MNYRSIPIVVILSIGLISPIVHASENTADIDVYIISGPHLISPTIKITNTGDVAVHNILITNVSIQGNILFNNRESLIVDMLNPGEKAIGQPNSLFLGYGLFSMTITIECEEGVYTTDETNGFIIGWFFLIP